MNMHYMDNSLSANGKAFRAWSGCLVELTQKASRIAEARQALNRQAVMGETIQTDCYLNTLETLLTEMTDDLERVSGHLPVDGVTPIWKAVRSFPGTEAHRQSRHIHRQMLKMTTDWLRASSTSFKDGAKLLADPDSVDQGLRQALDQYEAQIQQTSRMLTDWMDTAADRMAQLVEMSVPFLWMIQSDKAASQTASTEADEGLRDED